MVPNGEVADAALVQQARRGDGAAFETLVRRHYRAAYAIALAVSGNGMDAEDVCQDAFVKALERLDQCRHPERFAAWLFQIVRNRAHNVRDYRQIRTGVPLEDIHPPSPSNPGRDVMRSELRDKLQAAIAQLPPRAREVVLLHDLEGWRHRAIAESLGISELRSRQHLFQARKKLRTLLGSEIVKEYLHD